MIRLAESKSASRFQNRLKIKIGYNIYKKHMQGLLAQARHLPKNIRPAVLIYCPARHPFGPGQSLARRVSGLVLGKNLFQIYSYFCVNLKIMISIKDNHYNHN